MTPRIVEVRRNILKKNDALAAALRLRFADAGTTVINLVSSPGAGKTTLLQLTLRLLQPEFAVAALVGDLATERDADRLRQSGGRVQQITTGTVCHLDAEMIAAAIEDWPLADIDFLFIENVGNLVCPSSYDLGEALRVVLLSVTEGEDKPLKYPTIFNSADLVLLTKMDLASATEFRRQDALANIDEVRPGVRVLETSARSEEGMGAWLGFLCGLREAAMAGSVSSRLQPEPTTRHQS